MNKLKSVKLTVIEIPGKTMILDWRKSVIYPIYSLLFQNFNFYMINQRYLAAIFITKGHWFTVRLIISLIYASVAERFSTVVTKNFFQKNVVIENNILSSPLKSYIFIRNLLCPIRIMQSESGWKLYVRLKSYVVTLQDPKLFCSFL